jgi:hypothetical protein
MRTFAACLMACLMILACPVAADAGSCSRTVTIHGDWDCGDIEFDMEDDAIILTNRDNGYETVEITDEYDLYVNDEKVELDDDQRKLVGEFYESVQDLVKYAKKLGWEGAKIGAEGAKLGLKAIGGLFQVVFTSYDTDDFERDIEREAEKIEKRAEKLERKAEEVEEMAEDLEELAWELQREIPELRELEWL